MNDTAKISQSSHPLGSISQMPGETGSNKAKESRDIASREISIREGCKASTSILSLSSAQGQR